MLSSKFISKPNVVAIQKVYIAFRVTSISKVLRVYFAIYKIDRYPFFCFCHLYSYSCSCRAEDCKYSLYKDQTCFFFFFLLTLIQYQIFPKKYGGKYTVTLIPGDGIGQEIAASVKDVFKAANVPVEFEQYDVSGLTSEDDGLFQESIESLRRNKVGLKGTLFTPTSRLGHKSFNVSMRKDLDMYASLSLCKNFPGVKSRLSDVDIAIIRENTEGEYSGLEHQVNFFFSKCV